MALAAMLAGLCPCAWAGAGSAGPRKVMVQLQCVHQARFAGFYMAKDLGLYEKKGLSVTILPGDGVADPLEKLSLGRCDFAVSELAGALVFRSQGVGLVHLAQIIQKPSIMLVTFANSGIKTIRDMDHRRISLWSSHLSWAPRALLMRENVSYREVLQKSSMEPFLRRAVDVACATYFNEYHRIFQAGVNFNELRVFSPAKFGLAFPEDGIYAMQGTWNRDPEMCRAFVSASLEGWRRAFEQPERAMDAVMKRVDASHLANNRTHQEWMLEAVRNLVLDGDDNRPMGELSVKALRETSDALVKLRVMPRAVGADEIVRRAWK